MKLGKAIKRLRKNKSLNQSQFADNVSITQTVLSQIESGAKKPNSGTLKKICDYFEVPELVVYLLATDGEDIPAKNRELFEKVYPSVAGLILDIFNVPKELC